MSYVTQMDFGKAYKLMQSFWRDDTGATAIEYALIASGIALVIIGGLTAVGTSVGGAFDSAAAGLA